MITSTEGGRRPPQDTAAAPDATAGFARQTRQRRAVLRRLASHPGFVTAQALHAELLAAGERVGLATVYRTLHALAGGGEADVLTADGQQVYRACGTGEHHHHLVCRSCGKTVEVSGPAVERWAEAIGGEHGFVHITHTVEVFGTCADCASQPTSTTPRPRS